MKDNRIGVDERSQPADDWDVSTGRYTRAPEPYRDPPPPPTPPRCTARNPFQLACKPASDLSTERAALDSGL